MATTSNTITATAGQTEFSFSFPYLKKESIKVTIDTVATTAFTIPDNNPTTVILNSGATAGQIIVISRLTSTTATPATFFSGGAIRSQDLNNNFDSILYITQEKENELTEVIAGGIADGSITSSKLADQSVGTAALIDGGVATVDLADNAVTTAKILDDNVTTDKIINDAVTTAKIINDAVTTAKIINDAVTTPKIVDDAVTTPKIVDDAVTSAKIADGTILNINVDTAAAIAGTKISPDFGSQNIITTGSVGGSTATFSGDVLQYTTLKTPYCLRETDVEVTGTSTTSIIYDIPTWANRFVINMDGGAATGSNGTYIVQFGSATAFWVHSATFVNNPSSAYSTGTWTIDQGTFSSGADSITGGFALGLMNAPGWRSSSHTVFMKMFDRWSSSGNFYYEDLAQTRRGGGRVFTNPVDFIDTPARIRITGNGGGPMTGSFGVTWYSE